MSTPAADSLAALFETGEARRPGRDVAWLEGLRAEALAEFRARGIPTTALEDWRFTPTRTLEELQFAAAGAAPAPAGLLESARERIGDAHAAVFVNGRLHFGVSRLGGLPAGVRIDSLHRVLADTPERAAGRLGALVGPKRGAFAALNLALAVDGAFVVLAPGARLERPLHLVFAHVGSDVPTALHPRVFLHAGEGSHARVVEHHVGLAGSAGMINSATELWLDRAASLEHVLLQELPQQDFFFSALGVAQEAQSRFRGSSLALGGALARVELDVRLQGEEARADLAGLYLALGSQLLDHHVGVDHAVPRTTSRQLYKGVLGERSRGVFHGRVHVRPHAQKSDAVQTNRALLLTNAAQIDTKPQLEIYADDVKCSHGASVGQLDEGQLFYLRARGIPEPEARRLLTAAFAREAIEGIGMPALVQSLERQLLSLPLAGALP
jgi:Fe-S cluster assembly protein SufD